MANKTLNFDNFMTEKKQEPIMVTVFGKEYPVQPEIPAIVMVTLARSNEPSISESEAAVMILKAGDVLFGENVVNDFCQKGMTAENLVTLIKMVFDVINGKDVDGEDVEDISDEDSMTSSGDKSKK